MGFRRQMKALIECKVRGICARDQLVTLYIANRVEWHKNFRNSGLQRIRQRWELDCPVDCDGEQSA